MLKNKKLIAGLVALIVLIAAFAGVWYFTVASGTAGSKTIAVTITHGDETVNEVSINTDQEFLRGALEDEDLIAGTESDWGLYVLTVDGETADEANQEWWCFTMGGEWLMTGVDTTPIADGDTYEIALMVGY